MTLRDDLEGLLTAAGLTVRSDSDESIPTLDDYPYVILRLDAGLRSSDRVCDQITKARFSAWTVAVGIAVVDAEWAQNTAVTALAGATVGGWQVSHLASNPPRKDTDLADRTVFSGADIYRLIQPA